MLAEADQCEGLAASAQPTERAILRDAAQAWRKLAFERQSELKKGNWLQPRER
jgi:hypothetical protein